MSHTSTYRLYLVTHRATGKRYVGVTTNKNLNYRLSSHRCNSDSSLYEDIKAYGIEAFDICELEAHSDRKTAYRRESELMRELGTLRPDGYNLICQGVRRGSTAASQLAGLRRKGNTFARASGVEQVTRDGRVVATFRSIKLASEITGIHRTAINRSVNQPRLAAGGFNWRLAPSG